MPGAGEFLKHVSPGEKIKPSAATWNAFVDAAESDRRAQRGLAPPRPVIQYAPQVIRVKHQNLSGAPDPLPIFSIVAVTDGNPPPYLSDLGEYMPSALIVGPPGNSDWSSTASPSIDQTLVVTQQPLAVNEWGWAIVAGVAQVLADQSIFNLGNDYVYADPVDGAHNYVHLTNDVRARFRVINTGATDGFRWAAHIVMNNTPIDGRYVAGVPADWSGTPPPTIWNALDRLADVVRVLNGGPV